MAGVEVLNQMRIEGPTIARWSAVYTNARHEKVVATQLEERQIETFLPLYRSWRRWKDRRKLIELALFPSYVFVKIVVEERLRILQLPGVVNLVTFNGTGGVARARNEQPAQCARKTSVRGAVSLFTSRQKGAGRSRTNGRCRGYSFPQKRQIPGRNFNGRTQPVGGRRSRRHRHRDDWFSSVDSPQSREF